MTDDQQRCNQDALEINSRYLIKSIIVPDNSFRECTYRRQHVSEDILEINLADCVIATGKADMPEA